MQTLFVLKVPIVRSAGIYCAYARVYGGEARRGEERPGEESDCEGEKLRKSARKSEREREGWEGRGD